MDHCTDFSYSYLALRYRHFLLAIATYELQCHQGEPLNRPLNRDLDHEQWLILTELKILMLHARICIMYFSLLMLYNSRYLFTDNYISI